MEDPKLFTLPCRLGESKPFDTLADLGSCVNIIPLYLFKKLNIGLLKETDHIFRLADGTKSYPVGTLKDVEVHIGKLKLLNDFYVIDIKKDPETPLLVGRGFLATANAVIDCRMAKIAVGKGITRLVLGVKGVELGEEEAPYWSTLRNRESYKPWHRSNGVAREDGVTGIRRHRHDPSSDGVRDLVSVLGRSRGDGVAGIKRRHRDPSSDGVRDLVSVLGRSRGDGVAGIKRRHRDPSSDGVRDLVSALGRSRGDGVAGIKRRHRDPSSDGVRDLVSALGRSRLNEDLESST
nr:hypothetical protein [Tanacetum cinerariifolium]